MTIKVIKLIADYVIGLENQNVWKSEKIVNRRLTLNIKLIGD